MTKVCRRQLFEMICVYMCMYRVNVYNMFDMLTVLCIIPYLEILNDDGVTVLAEFCNKMFQTVFLR